MKLGTGRMARSAEEVKRQWYRAKKVANEVELQREEGYEKILHR